MKNVFKLGLCVFALVYAEVSFAGPCEMISSIIYKYGDANAKDQKKLFAEIENTISNNKCNLNQFANRSSGKTLDNVKENEAYPVSSTLLNIAIATDSKIAKMLIDAGADVNYKAVKNTKSPLAEAVLMGDLELVNILLDKGANPNDTTELTTKNDDGTLRTLSVLALTPFSKDKKNGPQIIDALVKKGGDINSGRPSLLAAALYANRIDLIPTIMYKNPKITPEVESLIKFNDYGVTKGKDDYNHRYWAALLTLNKCPDFDYCKIDSSRMSSYFFLANGEGGKSTVKNLADKMQPYSTSEGYESKCSKVNATVNASKLNPASKASK